MSEGRVFFKLTTIIDGDTIRQELCNHDHTLNVWILNTRDQQVREAFIRLGWKPPENVTFVNNPTIANNIPNGGQNSTES